MHSKKFFLNINGGMMRSIGSEITQTFYMLTKDPTSKDKVITGKDLDWLLSKSPTDYTFDVLISMFGDLADDNNRKMKEIPSFNCTDKITVPADKSPTKNKLETTVGRWIFNKVLIERSGMYHVLGYVNSVVVNKAFGKLEVKIADALLDDVISTKEMIEWIDIRDWLGLQLHAVVTTSFSPGVIRTPDEVKKLKNELLKKYHNELENGDTKASETIEKALIEKTKEVLKDDWGMDLYNSGARGSVNNNLKNINMIRGAVKNPGTGKYDIVTTSLMDGMRKKDIPAASNSIVSGAYPKHKLGQLIIIENLLNCWKLCKRQSAP